MSCIVCATAGVEVICPYHTNELGELWHVGNKIWCDFFHRGKIPRRLPRVLREDDYFDSGAS